MVLYILLATSFSLTFVFLFTVNTIKATFFFYGCITDTPIALSLYIRVSLQREKINVKQNHSNYESNLTGFQNNPET